MCVSEIAVIIGNNGRTVPLNEPGTVVVFRRVRGSWNNERALPFSLEEEKGLPGLRRKMAGLVEFLGGCRTFVAESASGASYFELEKARCQVWEIPGLPDEFLDLVWKEGVDEQEAAASTADSTSVPTPLETAPGKFTLSIKEIQGKRPEVSSKQVLRQFIRGGEFTELAIICDHLPPWIEVDAEHLGFAVETEYSAPHEVRVLLKRLKEGA
jgi:Fe-only nitrogenase accessory protein AnfO